MKTTSFYGKRAAFFWFVFITLLMANERFELAFFPWSVLGVASFVAANYWSVCVIGSLGEGE